jgi:hypothetical protein
MKKIYFTHCSAKKDLSLKLSNKSVTPDKLYTATPTQRFMNRCKEKKVKWAIFSDKVGIWFNNTKNLWYEKDPNTITEQEFNILLDDFNSKLKEFDEIYFYHNPGRFHQLYRKLLDKTILRNKIKFITHLNEITK